MGNPQRLMEGSYTPTMVLLALQGVGLAEGDWEMETSSLHVIMILK